MLEETVYESIEKMKKMERIMHVLVKENYIEKQNGKQEDNEKVTKIHAEINAGHKMWKRAQHDIKNKRTTWKIEQKKEHE